MSKLISVCMIVKNEEECLPRALENLGGFWDELIIVDTGSTDNTVEIAKAHGAKVLHYEWAAPGHKGEARNVGVDAATGEWIVVLDADEVIRDAEKLREAISQIPANIDAFNVKFRNVGENEHVDLEWYQMRIFRRGHYRYIHREHEIPVACIDQPGATCMIDIIFEHRPPLNRTAPKVTPMLERLRLDVEEHPDDPHSLYMLARQYGLAERYNEAIEAVGRYMAMPNAGMKSDASRLGGICCLRTGNRVGAYEWFHRATAYEPKRRLLWVELAQLYFDDRQYDLALALARMTIELPLLPYQRETQPIENLAYICQFVERCQHELAHVRRMGG
jgi:glycosyltransferase involved in cell wall biosynthesis